MTAPAEGSPLRSRLLGRFSGEEEIRDEEFDALAREVFRHQYDRNEPYRAYCERRGVVPDAVSGWTEIPAVPADAFKAAPLLCGDPAAAVAVFRTSGTTAGSERRGAHYFLDLSLYDASLRSGFAEHLLPEGEKMPIHSLVPSPLDAPDSSLSHMMGEVIRSFGAEGSGYEIGPAGIEHESLLARLRHAESTGRPVLIPGTSFAFVHLLDELRARGERLQLPPGSRLMDTGGFKGRSRAVSRRELCEGFEELLGIGPRWVVNEYGMTEMSSQLYDGPAGADAEKRMHRGPSWVRSIATDPETLRPVGAGEVGILRHCDLANLDSVMAVQTADLGRVLPGGLELLGRAGGAEARGCSIAMDELLSAIRRA